MYNGFTPTPRNPERLAYDAMQAQRTLAKFWALVHNQMHPITDADADRLHAALLTAEHNPEHQRTDHRAPAEIAGGVSSPEWFAEQKEVEI